MYCKGYRKNYLLLGTSGIVVSHILSKISSEPMSQSISKEVRDTGFVVGKCEIR